MDKVERYSENYQTRGCIIWRCLRLGRITQTIRKVFKKAKTVVGLNVFVEK